MEGGRQQSACPVIGITPSPGALRSYQCCHSLNTVIKQVRPQEPWDSNMLLQDSESQSQKNPGREPT